MSEHCNIDSLWEASRRSGDLPKASRQHIDACRDCRTLWDVLQAFSKASDARLAHAPSGWIQRAIALGQHHKGIAKLVKSIAELRFDSWVTPAAAVLRGATGEPSRRLRWKHDTWEVDLRAESSAGSWNCTAQVLESGVAAPGIALKAGSAEVHTDAAGLASWTTRQPPRTLRILHADGMISLGPISWKRPRNS